MAEHRRSFSPSLLDEITRNPLDPGYAVAARRRADTAAGTAAPPRRRSRRRTRTTAGLVLLGLLAGAAAGAGVADLRSQPLGDQGRAVLESEVQRRTDLVDTLIEDNQRLRQEIDEAEAEALGVSGTGLAAAVERLGAASGALPVTGPGVRVELDDAVPTDLSGEVPTEGRVQDSDLRRITNFLWAAGAEAIAVNGRRITSTSYIADAGEAVVVDARPLARPYVIDAVGDPDVLLTEVRTGAAGQYAALIRDTYDVQVGVSGQDLLELPGTARTLRWAVPAASVRTEPPQEQGPES